MKASNFEQLQSYSESCWDYHFPRKTPLKKPPKLLFFKGFCPLSSHVTGGLYWLSEINKLQTAVTGVTGEKPGKTKHTLFTSKTTEKKRAGARVQQGRGHSEDRSNYKQLGKIQST